MGCGAALKLFVIISALAYSTCVTADNTKAYNAARTNKSIVFVVDLVDLNDLKRIISNDFGNFGNNTHYDYSLVKFTDQKVETSIRRKSLDSFRQSVKETNLTQAPKTACDRKSISAIQEGLKLSSPDSFIIVITNSNPNEMEEKLILPEILSTVAEKRTRVFFILGKSKCQVTVPAYQNISTVSNGQLLELHLEEDNPSKLLNLLMNSTRVDLLAIDRWPPASPSAPESKQVLVEVDETMSEILISYYSPYSWSLVVTDGAGEVKFNDHSLSCTTSPKFERTKVCSVQKPQIGKWIISVTNATQFYSLRVYATSTININFGFDDYPISWTSNLTDSYCQPIPDMANAFLVNVDNSSQNASVSTAKMISIEGEELQTLELKKVDHTSNLYSSELQFNNSSEVIFHLQITGKIKDDLQFQRITPVAFGSPSGNLRNGSRNCSLPYINYVDETEAPSTTEPSSTTTSSPPTTPTPTPTPKTEPPKPPTNANSTTVKPTTPESKAKPQKPADGMSALTITLLILGLLLIVAIVIIVLVIYFKPGATYPVQKMFTKNRSASQGLESAS